MSEYIPETGEIILLTNNKNIPKSISITFTQQKNKTNIYPDCKIRNNEWKYFSDFDKQNGDKICIGAHFYYRKIANTSFTYIGIIDKIKSRGNQTIIKNGKEIQCEYYIFKTKNIISKGLSLCPGQLVPKIKKGYCRYMYDTCVNSGIDCNNLNTSPQRGILF